MRKILAAIIILTLISSCVLNRDHGKDIHTEYMDFNFKESHNEFIYKSKINAIADNDIYYKTHFSIKLPKNLKNWQISSNEFFFEYSGKEIIYINSGYKNKGQAGKWVIKDTNDDEIFNTLNSYWTIRKYSEENFRPHCKRQKRHLNVVYLTLRINFEGNAWISTNCTQDFNRTDEVNPRCRILEKRNLVM